MANVKLHHIYKVYDNGVKAVNDFNIDIDDNEFVVFVGPSGCGKSTTLRMIAGLEDITAGELFIGDTLVNDLEPKDRDIAFVFQNYALYPHMTVYENMAYGLKNKKLNPDEINKKVLEASEILGLNEYLDRRPKEMSGGQRQRVALGRALVRDPKVFLLDEPLSNLDAKLRTQMRAEITKLHKKIKTTFIYVTHDQVEAMTMGTRIVVMKDGYIQQIDTPLNLYNKPINKFVAGFIGTPQMNFFNIKLSKKDDNIDLIFNENTKYTIPYEDVCKIDYNYLINNKEVVLGCRPEHVRIQENGIKCKVNFIEQLGTESILYGDILVENNTLPVVIKIPANVTYESDEIIYIGFDSTNLHFFDKDSEVTILKEIPEQYELEVEVKNNKINLFNNEFTLPNCMNLKDDVYKVIVPSNILCKGNDFKVEAENIEMIKNTKLAKIKVNDRYIHLIVDSLDSSMNASILFENLTFIKNDEVIIKPINRINRFEGTIDKMGKKKDISYFFNIENNKCDVNIHKLQKVALIDGIKCHTYKYIFETNIDDIEISHEGIEATIIKEIDYINNKYYEVEINNKRFIINKIKNIDESKIYLKLNYDKTNIINSNSNIIVA